MKVLYLFNKVLGQNVDDVLKGKGHDSWLFGMLRLRKHDIQTDFLEIEQYIPRWLGGGKSARFLRKYILTMHYAHLPLSPLFFRYDVVFTSTAYGCLFLKALLGIKCFTWVILDFNILGTLQQEKTFRQKLFAWSITHGADGIVAISQAEADALKKRFPHLADRIIFLHEATDTSFFSPVAGIQEKNQVISVGNYGRDFDTVIEAVREINTEMSTHSGLEFIIAGKFPKDKLQSLPPYIQVVQLSQTDIVKAYAESKIVIISLKTDDSYFDSVGTLSLGEAMSMGKPIIVTHTKSMESYIQDGVSGVFVRAKNKADMKAAILLLLKNKEMADALGSHAREFALTHLDPDTFARQVAQFLKYRILGTSYSNE